MSDLGAIRNLHFSEKVGEPNYWSDCLECGGVWPCDAIRLLDCLERVSTHGDGGLAQQAIARALEVPEELLHRIYSAIGEAQRLALPLDPDWPASLDEVREELGVLLYPDPPPQSSLPDQ